MNSPIPRSVNRIFPLFALLIFSPSVYAAPKLAPIFGDHMVLPRDKPFPLWGSADAGEEIIVAMRGASVKTVADAEGKWTLQFPAQTVQATPFEVTIAGKTTIVLKDVLQGDVWLGSGQSNMVWPVKQSDNAAQEIKAANFPLMRIQGRGWAAVTPQNIANFSAAAYFFGRELQGNLNVPIGLIVRAIAGSQAELWTPREAQAAVPELKSLVDDYNARQAIYDQALAAYEPAVKAWQVKSDAAKAAGQPFSEKPPAKPSLRDLNGIPGYSWEYQIAPLAPFGFKGIIWYQGEANLRDPEHYKILFPTLIQSWRAAFQNADLPFFWVQLPGNAFTVPLPNEKTIWPYFREVQSSVQSLPNTGMALSYDIGGATIHPTNKQAIGKRLALLALNRVYNQKIEDSGPLFEKFKLKGPKIRLQFSHDDGLTTRDGQKPGGFTLSSDGKIWEAADAQIEGRDVVVSSPKISNPKFVRYAWAQQPSNANLANGAGLPMAPFRTDTTPLGGAKVPLEAIPNPTP